MTFSLQHLQLNDQGIAINTVTGETYRLIGPAFHLVRLLQKGANVEDLLPWMLGTYDIDEYTARRDLELFITMLEKLNWIEPASAKMLSS
jgi:hypothetical protein